MGDPANSNLPLVVGNSIDDSIVANANTPTILASLKPLGPGLARLLQRNEGLGYARANFGWQFPQFAGSCRQEKDFVVHVTSGVQVG